jgi:hypothetical protein
MKIVPPLAVTTSNLTASNVAITETAWTAGTYAEGVQRYVGTTLYEVIVHPHTSDSPTVGVAAIPPTWAVVGSINRFKMFDFTIGQKTSRASPITVTITPGEVVNTIALFELVNATSIRVQVIDPVAGTVYDQTRTLADYTGITDWYSYFFDPYILAADAVFDDLPAYISAAITVTISGSGTVEVGELVIGRSREYGSTAINTRLGIEDFSRKERDEFGNFNIVERRFAKLHGFDVLLANNEVNAIFGALSAARATATLYIGGSDFAETYALGFFRDFTILRSGPITSELSIEIEGLV